MPDIRFHNTLTGQLVAFTPVDPARVGIYACGPTVYAPIHVGNARPFVVFSQLKRFLVHEGYGAVFVANVTDVNDKIYIKAREQGVPSGELATAMTQRYFADTERLGMGRPDFEPLVTEEIAPIVDLIGALLENDSAYVASGDVYFRVRSDQAYGGLSNRPVEQMDQGEENALKQDPLDFALWKAEKPGEDTAWEAPWGRGRPGWHIECSAMAESTLGLEIDIHGGGSDLVFPHHENEAAQTRMGRGRELARIWMHNGMLEMAGDKMSKSVGNISTLSDVLDEHGRDALIMFFSSGHYRQPIAFNPDTMAAAAGAVRRVREAARKLTDGPSPQDMAPHRDAFFAALSDDFNTAAAMASVWEWIREANRRESGVGRADLDEMLGVLGLDNLLAVDDATAPTEVVALAEERAAARTAKDFAASDRLRDEIAARGWTVKDGPGGYELAPS